MDVYIVVYGFVGVFGRVEVKNHEGSALALEAVFNGLDPSGEHDGSGRKAVGGFDFKGGFGGGVEADRHIFNYAGMFTIFHFGHGAEPLHKFWAYSIVFDPFGRFRGVHVEEDVALREGFGAHELDGVGNVVVSGFHCGQGEVGLGD